MFFYKKTKREHPTDWIFKFFNSSNKQICHSRCRRSVGSSVKHCRFSGNIKRHGIRSSLGGCLPVSQNLPFGQVITLSVIRCTVLTQYDASFRVSGENIGDKSSSFVWYRVTGGNVAFSLSFPFFFNKAEQAGRFARYAIKNYRKFVQIMFVSFDKLIGNLGNINDLVVIVFGTFVCIHH